MSKSDPSRGKGGSKLSAALHFSLLALFLTVAAASAVMLFTNAHENRESDDVYSSLESFLSLPDPTASAPDKAPGTPRPSGTPGVETSDVPDDGYEGGDPSEPTPVPLPEADFEALGAMNPDVVAWLRIEGTNLSYPVVQGEDNEYYLTHIFDGSRNRAGCPYLDCANSPDFTDRNSIIYGHNRKNGAMFASLLNYTKQSYFDAHPSVTLLWPEGGCSVSIFAVLYANPDEAGTPTSPWRLSFANREELDEWAAALAARSLVDCGETYGTGQVLTLSTCDNGTNGRFVVLGWIPALSDAEETDNSPEPSDIPADVSPESSDVPAGPSDASTEPDGTSVELPGTSAEPSGPASFPVETSWEPLPPPASGEPIPVPSVAPSLSPAASPPSAAPSDGSAGGDTQ